MNSAMNIIYNMVQEVTVSLKSDCLVLQTVSSGYCAEFASPSPPLPIGWPSPTPSDYVCQATMEDIILSLRKKNAIFPLPSRPVNSRVCCNLFPGSKETVPVWAYSHTASSACLCQTQTLQDGDAVIGPSKLSPMRSSAWPSPGPICWGL